MEERQTLNLEVTGSNPVAAARPSVERWRGSGLTQFARIEGGGGWWREEVKNGMLFCCWQRPDRKWAGRVFNPGGSPVVDTSDDGDWCRDTEDAMIESCRQISTAMRRLAGGVPGASRLREYLGLSDG